MAPQPPTPCRILHLEDTAADAELTHLALAAEWPTCEFVHVTNGTAFAEALTRGPFDLILSDFVVPGFDGFSAVKLAKSVQPDVPFVLLSGTIGEETAVALLKAGATDYVLKDRPARLIPSIRRALQDRIEQQSRREAEQKVRETEERFRQLAEASNDVFWFADLNPFRPRYISPAIEQVWGRKPEEFYDDPDLWPQTLHPDDRARVLQNFNAWLAGDRMMFVEEFRVVRPDGSIRWVHDTGTFNADPKGKVRRASGVVRDITLLKEAAEQSLRAQRLESIGLLAGGVAHDLNNALAPIMMGLELMRPELTGKMVTIHRQMQISANRGAAMVRQLLGFARGAGGHKTMLDARPVIEEVAELAQSTFPKGITTTLTLPPTLPSVEIDATLLHQLVLNLCVNARDAMPEGGRIELALDATHIDESYAGFIAGAKPGRYVVITVTDSGVGIPPEVQAKIFDPFFTTKAAGVGTGLGLTTVAGIAHNHGGFVRVYSEVGRGTTFKVYLPASERDSHAAAGGGEQVREFRAHGEKVLVVDDEESVRTLLQNLLERFGFQVLSAPDGAEALALFVNHREFVKLVITDEQMPHLDGLALARALRHLAPSLPIIAMSGLQSESRIREFASIGVKHLLSKPFAITDLTEAIELALPKVSSQAELRMGA